MDRSSPPSPPPAGNVIFFSISDGAEVVYSYNGGGDDVDALAHSWREKSKRYHAWHSHTEQNRTFGFLMRDGRTYFAVGNDAAGASKEEMRSFLERLREAYNAAAKEENVEEKLIHRVIRMRPADDGTASVKAQLSPGSTSSAGMRPPKGDDGGGVDCDGISERMITIDGLQDPAAGDVASLSRILSEKLIMQQRTRRIWWRQVKIVAVVDALLCSIMFAIWLILCRGFQCVS